MTTASKEEKIQVPIEWIEPFFNDLDYKIAFLAELYKTGRRHEAGILCSCYIGSLASALYWPNDKNNFDFVHALKEYGGEEIFSYIHPKMLEYSLLKKFKGTGSSKKWQEIYNKIFQVLRQACGRLYDEHEIIGLIAPFLIKPEIEVMKKELWRGTYAAIVYEKFRNLAVHKFGPPNGTSFDNTTFRGQQCPTIDFKLLYASLKRIALAAKDKAINSKKWCDLDLEVKKDT